MALLKRSEILAVDDLKTETVSVPEWGGEVMVRSLTGAERDYFESSIVSLDGKKTKTDLSNVRAKLVVVSCVDENGDSLFTAEDVEALGEKSASALQRVFEVAQHLSGLTAADVEELAKNSVPGLSAGSTSG